ncbi:hypothetical protein GCM10009547_18660 [Sporichthya brevicatena]|uniref:FAD-dependent urate hydroxylase HpyO FAD/NAD(P)-binding domain-containing protein n=1 Tax=Sporichthya brevicatena TaxID=171442 RepID=A0ABN1GQT2_9ACTN
MVGAGPAGLAVVEALLARSTSSLAVAWLERSPRPDAMLRHGPAPGPAVLRGVAHRLAAVLADPRVRFRGNVSVGTDLSWNELCDRCTAVVAATGAPADRPLAIPGADAVGVGTLTYLRAARAGSADTYTPAIDPVVDTAVALEPTAADVSDLLAEVPRVELLAGVELVGIVGRNRARAVRVAERGPDGRLHIRDQRAQLVLRPHDPGAGDALPADVLRAGWAGRDPVAGGSHREDAAAVADAVLGADPVPAAGLPDLGTGLGSWDPIAEVKTLLARFAGEGTRPLADYDALLADADDD